MIKRLNEDSSLKFKNISPEEKSKKGILGRLYGPVASFAAPTRNGRHYSQDLWEKLFNSDLIKERFANGGIFGELCHPDYEEVDMSKVAVIMPEPPVKDDKGQLVTYIDILDTPCGKIAYQLAKYGYKFGISSRGTGDIIEDYEGNEEVDPDTYQLNAFDLVEIPAVESARLQFVESLDSKKIYNKTLRQRLTEELNKASEEDQKIMREALDNLDVKLNEGEVEFVATDGPTGAMIYKNDDGTYSATLNGTTYTSKDLDYLIAGLHGDMNMNANKVIDLDEKLIDPTEEDLAGIEAKFNELGLEIEGKGETLFGNKHYQLRKELDHKVTKEDLGPIFDALCDLSTDDMPTVCNVGVHRDGDNIISASLDVLKKQVREELEDEDGWGEEIPDRLEEIFGKLEDVMYEVRSCVRGSYGVHGDDVQSLVSTLNELSDELAMTAEDIGLDADRLTEGLPINSDKQREFIGMLSRLNSMADLILNYDQKYDFNDETDKLTLDNINDTVDKIQALASKLARFNVYESVSEDGCSNKEDQVAEDNAGNAGEDLVKELQEALLKNGELEKDNLSLQEKLSVCNAKENKLNEELSKYKKASAGLSQTSKNVKDLEEKLNKVTKELEYKDKLIESKNSRLEKIISSRKELNEKLTESEAKISGLEHQVVVLKDKSETINEKLTKVTDVAKRYQAALKESKERYLDAKCEANGLSKESVRAKLNESYSHKDIDSVCNKLAEQKANMSKLPFHINENMKVNFKASDKEYIKGASSLPDDEISGYLSNLF